MKWARLAALAMLTPLLLPGTSIAQRRVSAAVTFSHVDHRVEAGFGPERSSGLMAGGEIRVDLGRRLSVTVGASGGHLETTTAGALDRDIARLSFAFELEALRWLALEAELTRRSYSTVVARQRWTLGRLGAEARVPLSGGRLRAVGGVSLLPLVAVSGLSSANLGFGSGVGLAYTRGRLALDLRYDIERCGFPSQGPRDRSEQLSALALRIGWSPSGPSAAR